LETALQLVAFNIPYPPDYGGVIDIFYKVKALAECGISVYLHCFEYDRPKATELEKYCAKVFYYQRKTGLRFQFSTKPYISITRVNNQLLSNLYKNKCPILFEGLHTCFYLDHPKLKQHLKMVRTHNIEHEYYLNLAKSEANILKKIFFRVETCKLKRFEKILKNADHLLCISPNDNFYFDQFYGHSHFIPAFHPFSEVKSQTGRGKYILFHGNLSVSENIQAIDYLIEQVFPKVNFEIVIAGKNPSTPLVKKILRNPKIQLISNPQLGQMEELIRNAHICLIPTFQDTGLKLKLLASLFSGRFCLTNSPMVHKTGLENMCHVADNPEEIIAMINKLFEEDFTAEEIENRKIILEDSFSNRHNAMKIVHLMNETTGH